jgi:death-on-curing protein
MTEIVWLTRQTLILLQAESVAIYGGLPGIRDIGLFESALARPANQYAYDGMTDIADLAACHGMSLAKNHPFNDGNKRIAFIAMVLFAELNGLRVEADEAEAAVIMIGVADDSIDEAGLATWLRRQKRP